MDPFALQKAVHRKVNSVFSSLRAQAPGARMVGEFAVKFAKGEVEKRIHPQPPPPADQTKEEPIA